MANEFFDQTAGFGDRYKGHAIYQCSLTAAKRWSLTVRENDDRALALRQRRLSHTAVVTKPQLDTRIDSLARPHHSKAAFGVQFELRNTRIQHRAK